MSDLPLFDLSVIVPTRNRADALLKTLLGIDRATHGSHEVIVVDGASTDATDGVLMLAGSVMGGRLRVVREGVRAGFGAACNKALRIARGRHVCVLHDDAHPLDGALDRAAAQLDEADDAHRCVVALFAPASDNASVASDRVIAGRTFAVRHLCGTLVAEFPLARREVFRSLPLDVTLATGAATLDFSLAAWNAGLEVRPAIDAAVDRHDPVGVSDAGEAEVARVVRRWALPESTSRFDASRPCTLHRRTAARRAA